MRIPRRKPVTAKVGLFGVGHQTYWGQFPGLREELMGHHATLRRKVEQGGVEVVDFGMIDTAQAAYAALPVLRAAGCDLLLCNMLTYATSSTWAILRRELDVPMVLVALQPLEAMDYARATTYMQLCNDNICSLPEFAGVSIRLGKPAPATIIGTLAGDALAEADLARWLAIAKVLHAVRGARLGQMGHSLEAMLDMHHDPAAFTAQLGLHVVMCEPDEVLRHYRDVDPAALSAKREEILAFFDTPAPGADPLTARLRQEDLDVAARAAVALDRFVDDKQLDGLAYYYEALPDSEMRELVTNFTVGNSLLTAAGFPMCGENDLKTCLAMLMMDRLDIGGSFAEFHPVDFREDFVLVGHDGPHHVGIAGGKPVLRSLSAYHGKPGRGASVEFQIRPGPITLLIITSKADGRFKFVLAEGESLAGPIPATGNTNTRARFAPDVRTFLRHWIAQGPTHHFALGVGHHARTLGTLGELLGLETALVAPDGERG